MKRGTFGLIGVASVLLACAATASAQTAGELRRNSETGHYYQIINDDSNRTWQFAQDEVDDLPCLIPDATEPSGVAPVACSDPDAIAPHLATITTAREELFVDTLRDEELNDTVISGVGVLNNGQVWLGGVQSGSIEPGGGWSWVNGEGDFPGENGGIVYTNWNIDEPNNAGNEDHLTLGRYGLGGGWNDELDGRASIGGFAVEWDVPLDAGECVFSPDNPLGCITVLGQTTIFPEGSNPNNASISFNSWEINDPRVNALGQCVDRRILEIFGNTGIGSAPGIRPSMYIPAYLCGSPDFVVVAINSSELVIETGTVGVIHDTPTVLPGNMYADGSPSVCENPIVQVPFTDGDPQYQDIVVWQTTDPANMLEQTVGPSVAVDPDHLGAAGEFTDACGSSRARVKGASYYGVGFHIDLGPGNTWAGNAAGNFDGFVALTRYKLELLLESVELARTGVGGVKGIIKNGDYKKMRTMVSNSIDNLDDGNYGSAVSHMTNFVKFIVPARYNIIADENYEGEHIMRGSNILFTLDVKVVPYAP